MQKWQKKLQNLVAVAVGGKLMPNRGIFQLSKNSPAKKNQKIAGKKKRKKNPKNANFAKIEECKKTQNKIKTKRVCVFPPWLGAPVELTP